MDLHISDEKTIFGIKDAFNELYPFLKLEFFRHSHDDGSGSPKSDMITEDLSLGEIRTIHNEGDIQINGNYKVGEVEQEFESKYGIHVQIFRKSGEIWLETSATDDWTLNEQNQTAEEMS